MSKPVLAALVLVAAVPASEVMDLPNRDSPGQLGLGGMSYYNPDLVFKDLARASKADWTEEGDPLLGAIVYDADGYPLVIPGGRAVSKTMCVDTGGGFRKGAYVVLWRGSGTVEPSSGATRGASAPGRQEWMVSETANKVGVRIRAVDPADPIRDLCIVPAIYEHDFRARPFNPEWAADFGRFRVLRFMDWFRTNQGASSEAATWRAWNTRATTGRHTQAGDPGVAFEFAAQLAGEVMADAWICVPHNADDDFVRRMARLFRDQLDPRLRLWVEYSNETWNAAGGFKGQWDWCTGNAKLMGTYVSGGSTKTYTNHHYHAKRSLEIWRLFEEEFGSDRRLVRVMGGQGANPSTFTGRIDVPVPVQYQAATVLPRSRVDAVAMTNYWAGGGCTNADAIESGAFTDGHTVQGYLDRIAWGVANPRWGDVYSGGGSAQEVIAIAKGLPVVGYEGGLGCELGNPRTRNAIRALSTTGDDDATLAAWERSMVGAAAAPEQEALHEAATDSWFAMDDTTGDDDMAMFSQFVSASKWDKWGVWGIHNRWEPLENPERMAGRHRLRGLQTWIDQHRWPNAAPVVAAGVDRTVAAGAALALSGSASDDGYRQIGRVHLAWTVTSAPQGATVAFADRFSAATTVSCSTVGTYVLRLNANDGWAIGYDELVVTVGGGGNRAPIVGVAAAAPAVMTRP